ncbi:putative quinol monooxygenase [Microbacterium sp. UBA3394]|uniref:putative quinol monooxygenase n=1 Tax=Microbacterium sp. UBA3394 TaxID=1946945 RepID=UPI000C3AE3CA|nr:putative quinol monooxygenase [Microbacterium sp. UBA3394]MAB81742.1 antibiotic biosynthesis monooxygenase [Planctomycetota bacterium]MAM53374.1 antibiotic biosynthesis monooxygenase [Microbacterium sp.]
MKSVVVTAVFTPLPGKRTELIDAMSRGIEATHQEAGCQFYALHDAQDGTLVLLEKWDSSAALEAHSRGNAIRTLASDIAPLLAGPELVTVMTAIRAGDPVRGVVPDAVR